MLPPQTQTQRRRFLLTRQLLGCLRLQGRQETQARVLVPILLGSRQLVHDPRRAQAPQQQRRPKRWTA